MRLALLAIMQNEADMVERWLAAVHRVEDRIVFDEIVVVDGGSSDDTVALLVEGGVKRVVVHPFEGDFAAQRNAGIAETHCEWVFELDADERVSIPLLCGLRQIMLDCTRNDVDCVGIPRLNFHDGRLQPSPGASGLDYQYRLHRRHVLWQNAVHEEPVQATDDSGGIGWRNRIELDVADGHFLLHEKSEARHAARNAAYARIAAPHPGFDADHSYIESGCRLRGSAAFRFIPGTMAVKHYGSSFAGAPTLVTVDNVAELASGGGWIPDVRHDLTRKVYYPEGQ